MYSQRPAADRCAFTDRQLSPPMIINQQTCCGLKVSKCQREISIQFFSPSKSIWRAVFCQFQVIYWNHFCFWKQYFIFQVSNELHYTFFSDAIFILRQYIFNSFFFFHKTQFCKCFCNGRMLEMRSSAQFTEVRFALTQNRAGRDSSTNVR